MTTVRPRSPLPAGGGTVVGGVPAGAEMLGAGAAVDVAEAAGSGCREMVRVGGLAVGAPDPQAAGATARTTAKTAINGRDGAHGIPVGRTGRTAGSGPPRFAGRPGLQRFTVGSG
jgi:hypothetical protein